MTPGNLLRLLLALVATLAPSAGLAAGDEKEVYTAFAVNMGGTGPGATTTFEITIDRWSTDEERTTLIQTLKEKGHDEFMKVLRKQKETGFFRGSGAVSRVDPFPSTRLLFANQEIKDGVRHVTLVTDRPIGFREAAAATRSADYDTTAILLEFPAEGGKEADGKGVMYVAFKLRFDEKADKLEVEEWGNEPVRLTKVNRQK